MPTNHLPAIGDKNWGLVLNNWLKQIGQEANGGLNFGDNNYETGLNLGVNDTGWTYLNTETKEIKRWTDTGWTTLLGSGTQPALASPPTSPVIGQTYYNTVDNKIYVYDGTVWVGV